MSEILQNHPAYEIIGQDWQLIEIALLVERMHTNVEHHGFGHPLDTVVRIKSIADQYEVDYPDRPPLNRIRLYKTALTHDIFVDEELDTSIFPTLEHRSAYIAGYIFREMGDSEEDILDMQKDIISTNPYYPREDDHATALVMADIGNTVEAFSVYFSSFKNVYLETQRKAMKRYGRSAVVSPKIFFDSSVSFLKLYFGQELGFGEKDKNEEGVCKFVAAALHNFAQARDLGKETWETLKDQLLSEL